MANILVLEDDEIFASLLQDSLEQAGHFPITCEDATETIAQYHEYSFDLVITDLIVKKDNRAVPDGGVMVISFLQGLARDGYKIPPIIAMSGATQRRGLEQLLVTSKDLGATATLTKPFEPTELLTLIDQLLERSV
ncbi:response regulator transcription factor [Phaeobacter gallaeciensis]|uniref:Response regulator n=1 Tax=Phaeobacter gallaeciensis TaxID=60890 RepID=A0AAC9Z5M6_9RHOB|nr:response regulator [Phaeobacter gallaeciensis]AHD08362.1 Response regulator [Phaeobacter gallaeciensis DSM 26640]ATE91628.1 Response regulator [Phaeobacter gallaeciensis]ATE98548.1 Response regulator [Phaeobacter gallaeciensis]ATF00244.1 Response regulator [Phaeobacter gallaeciensis]ATF04676.1 Response regulator [Phaeobacter gallaeciensis]